MCVNIGANRTRVPVGCDVAHYEKKISFMILRVEGHPKNMNIWTDDDWARTTMRAEQSARH